MMIIPFSDRSATASVGFRQTNQALRSLLMHPIGIGLASLLNEKEISSTTLPIDKKLLVYNYCDKRDDVFSAAVAQWNGETETDLAQKIMERIKEANIEGFKTSETKLSSDGNDNVLLLEVEQGINDGKSRLDFVISKKNGQNPKSIVMMIEFGIGHQLWWEKQDQILRYVELLLEQEESETHRFAFDEPILLTVITVNNSNNSTEGDGGVETTSRTEGDGHVQAVDVRYGIFLCTRRNDSDFRIALLWRKHNKCLNGASKEFGKILYAASVCTTLRGDVALRNSYQYLGPNCCKFDNLVYRCYDNRLRYTERRPNMYETCASVKKDCKVVLHITDTDDPSSLLVFGNVLPTHAPAPTTRKEKNLIDMEWLWKFKGQLKVISTPYHVGKHHAKKHVQFFPIIDHLEQIHADGFVHGDIRAYNMVLNYKDDDPDHTPEGYLIDFDFGGHIDQLLTYPTGYVQGLADGFRLGKQGESITAAHDWYALGDIIMNRHELRYTRKMPTNELRNKLEKAQIVGELIAIRDSFMDTRGDFSSLQQTPCELLKTYIRIATDDGFYIVLERRFRDSLEANEFLEDGGQRTDTKGATGSSPKHDAKRP